MGFASYNLLLADAMDFGVGGADPGQYVRFSEVLDLGQNRQIIEGAPCYVHVTFPETFVAGNGVPRLWIGLSFNDTETFKSGFVPAANLITGPMFGGGSYFDYGTGAYLPAGLVASAMQNGNDLWLPLPIWSAGAAGVSLNLTESTLSDRVRFMALSFWQPRIGSTFGPTGIYFSAGKITATLEPIPATHDHYPNAI